MPLDGLVMRELSWATGALAAALAALLVAGCGAAAPTSTGRPTSTASPSQPAVTTSPPPSTVAPSPAPPPTTAPPPTAAPTSPAGGCPSVPASLLGQIVTRIPTSQRVVALTFDAGANADGVASILSTLRAQHVPATFFLTGRFVTAYPSAAAQMAAAGRVGNHTVDHPHLPQLSDAAVRAEVLDAAATIGRVTGADPQPFFRFPFGDSSPRTLQLVNSLCYLGIGWTVDSLGWEGTSGGVSVDTVVSRVVGARTPGEIVLMHVGSNPDDGTTLDAEALPRVITGLRAYGYAFVTLAAILGS